ncbi:ATP-binding protein [Streptomyces fenghuangensis]|uniref:ATP-binding protein n=1 Tax=Streptomyces TaxID=1883 RepID=UPI001EDC2B60|nr:MULTISPECIES: ATP-binding protein [Streptomyces]MCG3039148.1 ATP-binding protein [Streptomyces sp. ICN903]MDH2409955.1 ATP-binding protein [Streptomyces chitinivorans]
MTDITTVASLFGSGLAVALTPVAVRQARLIRGLRTQLSEARSGSRARDAELARLAGVSLPATVQAVSDRQPVPDLPPVSAELAGTPFARHLDDLQEQVVRALTDAEGRTAQMTQTTLLSVARTLQALANKQQMAVTDMLRKHDSPEVLGDLQVVDHATAQILRRAQAITVVCGSYPGRQHDATTLSDVVRGAVSRILDFRRVRIFHDEGDRAVVGRAVEGLVLALAELLENATRYSHPDTQVLVQFERVHNGLSVIVDDKGVGLQPGERERAQRLLSGQGPVSVTRLGDPPKFGFAVIGMLSSRYGFEVSVTKSPYSGVRAVAFLPSSLLTDPAPAQPVASLGSSGARPRAAAAATAEAADVTATEAAVGPADPAGATTAGGLPKRRRRTSGAPAPSTPAPRSAGQPAPGRSPRDSAAALGGFARAARTAQRNTSTSGGSEPDGSEGNTEA